MFTKKEDVIVKEPEKGREGGKRKTFLYYCIEQIYEVVYPLYAKRLDKPKERAEEVRELICNVLSADLPDLSDEEIYNALDIYITKKKKKETTCR